MMTGEGKIMVEKSIRQGRRKLPSVFGASFYFRLIYERKADIS